MAVFSLPTGTSSDTVQRVQISDNTYDFRYRWNTRECAWYCHIGLNGDDPKVKFKMVVGMDLLEPYIGYEEVPNGSLFLIDTDALNGRPGRDDVGQEGRFRVLFIGG